MKSRLKPDPHTIAEPISTTLKNGETITGTLWLHPSRKGSFVVEYQERTHTDGTAYMDENHLRAMARQILRELAGE